MMIDTQGNCKLATINSFYAGGEGAGGEISKLFDLYNINIKPATAHWK
jgi:hypothetical protein